MSTEKPRKHGRKRAPAEEIVKRMIKFILAGYAFRIRKVHGHMIISARKMINGHQEEKYVSAYDDEVAEICKKFQEGYFDDVLDRERKKMLNHPY